MKNLARSHAWWQSINENIEHVAKSWESCQVNQNLPSKALVHPWKKIKSPWVRIHSDFEEPYFGKMFLALANLYSKWFDVISMSNTKTTSLLECLRQSFGTYDLPFVIVTDNWPSFISNEFKIFVRKNGIKHVFIAPCHPSSNGMAEWSV